MKVKAIKDYNDTQFKRLVKTGEVLDVTEERAAVLITAKVAVVSEVSDQETDKEETAEVSDQEIDKEETAEKPKKRKKTEA